MAPDAYAWYLDHQHMHRGGVLDEELAGRCCVSDVRAREDSDDDGWRWSEAGGEFVERGANPIMQG